MLGIHPAASEFTALFKTANGTVRGAPVELDMVEVGDLMVRDVAAMVLPDGALSDNLLGLSFLSRLRRFEYATARWCWSSSEPNRECRANETASPMQPFRHCAPFRLLLSRPPIRIEFLDVSQAQSLRSSPTPMRTNPSRW